MAKQLAVQLAQGATLKDGLMAWTTVDRITYRPTEGGSNGEV